MKLLSDNTADRILRHLDATEGAAPRRTPRGASTTPPSPMWQIHVTPAGAVTVDGGDVYADSRRYSLGPSTLGTISDDSFVVWQAGADGGQISLVTTLDYVGNCYRVIGEISESSTGLWQSKQYVFGPIEADGALLPFDLGLVGGLPSVYVPQTSANLVYVRGSQHTATRHTSATPTQGRDGWRQFAAGTTGVWVWARWDHTTENYLWGLSDTDPTQHGDAQDRYLLSMLLGTFNGTTGEVTSQSYHGDIIVADDNGDDLAVERDDYSFALSLLAFQAGAHTSTSIHNLDILVREIRSGDYPHAPYQLNYLNGTDLMVEIDNYINNTITQIVEGAILELLAELITALGGSGDTISDLVNALDARYQPICTTSSQAWGISPGQWTTTPPST